MPRNLLHELCSENFSITFRLALYENSILTWLSSSSEDICSSKNEGSPVPKGIIKPSISSVMTSVIEVTSLETTGSPHDMASRTVMGGSTASPDLRGGKINRSDAE